MLTHARLLLALAALTLPACGAVSHAVPGSAGPARTTSDNASALPGDNASALPGDNASALPGDNASALPGASLACAPPATGSAACTVALNLSVAPLSDPNTAAALIPGFHPDDLRAAYRLPDAPGGTVAAVVAYDAPAVESDLAVYRAAFGMAPCTSTTGCLRVLNQRGGAAPPAPDAGWAREAALDLEMISAACPRCRIVLVEADSSRLDDLGAAVDTAANVGAVAIGNSYYADEWAAQGGEDAHYHHPGVLLTAASGDRPKPSYPAVVPEVIAVGGTSLQAGTWAQTSWPNAGGGCSAYVARPRWQPLRPCGAQRAAVDVAVVGNPQTGVAMYNAASGGWFVVGGTSVGAPLVAAAHALSGNPAIPGFAYAHPAAFADVAPAGFDAITGLGSPLGVAGL